MTGNSSGNRDYSQEATKEGALYKFFLDGLKDMYFAEKHILEALPKMKEAATTEDLQDAFEDHHLVTQKQVSRLEKVFKSIGESPEAKKCDAIIGIVKEGENIIKETEEGTMTRDAALIIAAQKVEHYEIASYGGLVALAETLQLDRAADLLHQTLEEEEETDLDLTDIAESSINFRAADEEDDEEEDEDDDMD
ncbi:MAG: ferritin-like domain-containing protein [Flavobacteriia bacterium]|nr:ferritin-like domain-containing protein [Flavobacteriia bacterium]MBH2023409.1 ferritin-like domain-containing protein [Flavobacteriales bacterium]